ncbi:hypothetical protein I6F30_25455 [Bradyrhizobium sp. NBAIM20]|uniref:hypothetical protein n=1 Tax=unclassified Bradyrhizobium TaxID=2631580 RepID=UPI001CD3C735|nr:MULTISPECIES: hypothetical protein [unclassified Bradyrhizobium]MCA1414473.1 hypothetical protein [Bradyrhizobium sp. NBAIM20]MCA1459865.1 hypothetical protein [Bradyrhizobium sp. NBAIM18]
MTALGLSSGNASAKINKTSNRSESLAEKLDGALAILAALETEGADLTLAAVERRFGATEKLTEHRAKIAAARTAVEELRAAQVRAQEIERMAASARVLELRSTNMDQLLAGISAKGCCTGCSAAECMIGPGVGRCCHPNKGGLPYEYFNDPVLRGLQHGARAAIQALERGDDEGEEQGEAA